MENEEGKRLLILLIKRKHMINHSDLPWMRNNKEAEEYVAHMLKHPQIPKLMRRVDDLASFVRLERGKPRDLLSGRLILAEEYRNRGKKCSSVVQVMNMTDQDRL